MSVQYIELETFFFKMLRKLMTKGTELRRHSEIPPVNWSTERLDRSVGSGSASEQSRPATIDQFSTTWNQ
jgi:hypothetical protein